MKASDLLPKVIVDDKAETITEMASSTPLGLSAVRAHVKRMLAAGRYEQVKKLNKANQLVNAYRVKK